MLKADTTTLVEELLKQSQRARMDDKYLQLGVWELQGLKLNDIQRARFLSNAISAPETIRRTRQKLQQEGKYLPPKPVQEARQQLAEETKHEMVQEKLL